MQRLLEASTRNVKGDSVTDNPRFGHDFSRIPVHSSASRIIQPKLEVNAPGDICEQEANFVADQVIRMPEPQLQHTCACGGGCPKCKGEQGSRERLHTKSVSVDTAGHGVSSAEPVVRVASASGVSVEGGQPLPDSVRSYFEPRFGHDFTQVRVHTDARAVQLSRALRAEAFTYGNNIYFNERRFVPDSTEGMRLLAHELAHTIQQRGTVGRMIQRREVCDEEAVCHSEPDEELNYTPNVAAVAGASLMPPGDCTSAEHRALQAIVDRDCDRERRCTQNDDCATIWQRIQHNAECIRARSTINARCFRGGDIGHTIAVANAVGALGNCWAVYNRRCQPRTPPVPVPVPVPETRPRPIVDRSFMEEMAAITGLTGTALVLYLIVSEGSRLFPPRNLVPVP